MLRIRCEYLPLRRSRRRDPSHRGLAEQQVRARLLAQGWVVWRGGMLAAIRSAELYPNVERKYLVLRDLLARDHPAHLELLQYLCAVHHGMPDFLCYRERAGVREWKFVECKFRHEALHTRQARCILTLASLGFRVEVHRIVGPETKVRSSLVDISEHGLGARQVGERQLTLLRRYAHPQCVRTGQPI